MKSVMVSSKYRAFLKYDGTRVKATGPLSLLNLIQNKIQQQGSQPEKWSLLSNVTNGDEAMLNNFISKMQTSETSQEHDEICHCRMVGREKIEQSIFQGSFSREEISRTTLAGTGCGSCRNDIDKILKNNIR
ncbi:(2Fe-2S)-binding protein [bacterium]|nr:(2Fe-2S)-binding protein [bacterium]